MTVALEAFDENSLGNCEVSVSYIAMTTECEFMCTGTINSCFYGDDTPSPQGRVLEFSKHSNTEYIDFIAPLLPGSLRWYWQFAVILSVKVSQGFHMML